jgi:hypothetical protein
MANDKPNKPSLAALKARMDSLQELIAFERDAPRRFDLIQELLLTNELVAEIEKAHKNKIEDASGDLMTARLVNLTTEIGQLIVKSKPVLNAALYLFLFTTLN